MVKFLAIIAVVSAVLSLILTAGFVLDNLGGFFWDNFEYDALSLSNLRYSRVLGVFVAMVLVTYSLLFAAAAGLAIVVYLIGLIAVYVLMPGLESVRAFVLRQTQR